MLKAAGRSIQHPLQEWFGQVEQSHQALARRVTDDSFTHDSCEGKQRAFTDPTNPEPAGTNEGRQPIGEVPQRGRKFNQRGQKARVEARPQTVSSTLAIS